MFWGKENTDVIIYSACGFIVHNKVVNDGLILFIVWYEMIIENACKKYMCNGVKCEMVCKVIWCVMYEGV